jgi:serine/threonine-protein kinase
VEFRILGPLEVVDEDGARSLGGPKQRAVVAHLILRAGRAVPADQLIDELWGEAPPETARNTLQTYVYRLRKVLGEHRLEGRTGTYVLHAEPSEIDAVRFERLVRNGRGLLASDPAAALAELDEALALWRGPAFADFPDEPSLRGEVARLEELRLAATEHQVTAQLALGRHTTVIGALEVLTDRYPLRERLWAGLMLALYRSGRQAEALDAYRGAQEVLAEELGIDPSTELQELHERILAQDAGLMAGGPTSAPVTPSPSVRGTNGTGELAPGTVFGGYRIGSVLGRGGMSVVYLAEHLGMERKIALKVLAPQLSHDERFRERFVRESRIAAGMEHPAIVPIYEAGAAEGLLFIAMRYVPAGDLGVLIRREGVLDPERSSWIVGEVASALDAAHARGLVHRDVKPGNVLVVEGEGRDGRDLVYLSDFGLTKRLGGGDGGLTQTGQFVGSVDFVAPEQIEGRPLDGRTDVYSLACVLFECLTGRPPFARDDHVATLYAHLRERPPRLTASRPELPIVVDRVLARALAKAASDRYPTCGEFATAVHHSLGPLAADAPGASDRSTAARRWRAGAIAIAAAAILGLVAVALPRGSAPAVEGAPRSPPTPISPTPGPHFVSIERALTSDEERLLTYIPAGVRLTCLPHRDAPTRGELASLVCFDGDVEVLYRLHPSAEEMTAAVQVNANIYGAPDGECATDPVAVGPYSIEGQTAGRVLCYELRIPDVATAAHNIAALFGAAGEANWVSHIEWTDERIFVSAHAIRNDRGDLNLYDWWRSSAGPGVSRDDGAMVLLKDGPDGVVMPPHDGTYLVSTQGAVGRRTETEALRFHGSSYDYAIDGTIYESGTVTFRKPDVAVFEPSFGVCNAEDAGRPAVFGWSGSGRSVTWEFRRGGSCAGPQPPEASSTWIPAPVGTILAEDGGRIAVMDPGGFGLRELNGAGTTWPNVTPDWSPDGTQIVYAGGSGGLDLLVMNADGTGVARLTDDEGDESMPAWSPDGSRIAFAFEDPGDPDRRSGIGVVNPDGTAETDLLIRDHASVSRPAWSPDGDSIAFTVEGRGSSTSVQGFEIYVMDEDGRHPTRVFTGSGPAAPASWTPTGQRLVFWTERDGLRTLYSMRPDGSDLKVFLDNPPDATWLGISWSPDRRWIILSQPPDLGGGTYLMSAAGGPWFLVSSAGSSAWRPNGVS